VARVSTIDPLLRLMRNRATWSWYREVGSSRAQGALPGLVHSSRRHAL